MNYPAGKGPGLSLSAIDKIPKNIMETDNNRNIQAGYFLRPGYIYLPLLPTVISTVLGSSVSVCLYDRKKKIGGMNHFRLPESHDSQSSTSIYGNIAIKVLIRMMLAEGSEIKNLEAQIIGGAYNSSISPEDVGRENIKTAKKILYKAGVRIASEDSGGIMGRKIVFETVSNTTAVIKVEKLRTGDWYPYLDQR